MFKMGITCRKISVKSAFSREPREFSRQCKWNQIERNSVCLHVVCSVVEYVKLIVTVVYHFYIHRSHYRLEKSVNLPRPQYFIR